MRRRVLIDVETSAWYCASGIPELVVLGYSFENEPEPTLVTDRGAAVALWQSWVTDPNCDIIAHNSPFDCSVMAQSSDLSAEPGTGWAYAQVFAAYEAGRIYCTEVRQRLCEMYDSRPDDRGYGLAAICARVFGLDIGADKKAPPEALAFLTCGISSDQWPESIREVTPWRYKYGELRGVPLEHWPSEARRYAADDVTLEWRLFHEQEKYRAEQLHYMGLDPLADQHIEARAAWDLHILRTPGFMIDVERVRRLVDLYYRIERTCAEILATHCAWCGSELAPVPAECSRCGGRDTLIQRKVIHRGKPEERTDEHGSQTLTRRLVWETLGRGGSELTDGAKARGEPLGERSVKCDGKAMMRCVAAKNGRHVTTDGGAHAFQADGAQGLTAYLRSLDPPEGGCLVINARRLFNKAQKTRTSFLEHMTADKAMAQVAATLGISISEAEHRYLVGDWKVRTSYQVLVSTGRTASRNWNVQNVPARTVKDESIGVRGCVVPPPGWVIIDSDYGQLELCHYAQVLTDMRRESSGDPTYVSSLAQAINEGKDGHVIVAAQLVGISYDAGAELHAQGDKEFAPMRQLSKVANYGFSGGMGAATFVEFAAAQGLTVQRVMAQKARDAFMSSWHESPEYFAAMGAMCGADAYGEARIQILRTGLIRGRVPFCAACNIQFQGPAARGCKQALRALIRACYQEPESPLFGSRPLAFVHDEFVTVTKIDLDRPARLNMSTREETILDAQGKPDGFAWSLYGANGQRLQRTHTHEAASVAPALLEQDRIMVAEMSRYLPDVRITAEGTQMARWGKG
jgi:hypothetical protein